MQSPASLHTLDLPPSGTYVVGRRQSIGSSSSIKCHQPRRKIPQNRRLDPIPSRPTHPPIILSTSSLILNPLNPISDTPTSNFGLLSEIGKHNVLHPSGSLESLQRHSEHHQAISIEQKGVLPTQNLAQPFQCTSALGVVLPLTVAEGLVIECGEKAKLNSRNLKSEQSPLKEAC